MTLLAGIVSFLVLLGIGACVVFVFGMIWLSFAAMEKTGGYRLIIRPYSADSIKQESDRLAIQSQLEDHSRVGRITNKAAKMMTFCFIIAAMLAGLEFGMSKFRDVPSEIFRTSAE